MTKSVATVSSHSSDNQEQKPNTKDPIVKLNMAPLSLTTNLASKMREKLKIQKNKNLS
jgi:hypothetical protein